MRYISILLALLFAFATTSYALPGNGFTLEARKDRNNTNGENSLKKTCKTIRKLTKLTELANNQTRLDERVAAGKLTTEKVDQIKAKAANATIELQTLQSNATLVQECAVVNAQRKDVRACRQMKKLERLSQIANNQSAITAISEAKGMSEARLQKFQEKVQEAEAKLQEMQANSTLTEFCAQRQQQKGSGGSGDGASGSSEASTGSGSGTSAAASTGGASSLTLQTVPYALASTLAAVFVFFL